MPGNLHLLTLTLSAFLLSMTEASKCGSLTVTQCTDQQCSVGCQSYVQEPSPCGTSYLKQSIASGGVAASCDDDKLFFTFYESDTCLGAKTNEEHAYNFGFCIINDLGSVNIKPLGDQPEYFELTQAEYEERFNQRWTTDAKYNVLGYGQQNQFVPPLREPTWLLTEIDRYDLVDLAVPFAPFMNEAFISALGNYDSWTGFWYNNGLAAGTQLYPDGLSKYFDMYSLTGATNFLIFWVWYHVCDLSRPLFILPLNVWLGILNGDTFDDIWKVLIPGPIAWFLHIRGENGWIIG